MAPINCTYDDGTKGRIVGVVCDDCAALRADIERYSRERDSLLAAAAGAEARLEKATAELSRLRALCRNRPPFADHCGPAAYEAWRVWIREVDASGRGEG